MFIPWWILLLILLLSLCFFVNAIKKEKRLLNNLSILSRENFGLKEELMLAEKEHRNDTDLLNEKINNIKKKYITFIQEVNCEVIDFEELNVHVDESAPRMNIMEAYRYHETEEGQRSLLHSYIKFGRENLRGLIEKNKSFIADLDSQ